MSKLDSFIWWANVEVYRTGVDFASPNNPQSGCVRIPSKTELDSYFDEAGCGKFNSTSHWCGIFQTYLMKKAGIECKWVTSLGIKDLKGEENFNGEVRAETNPLVMRKDLRHGDILIVEPGGHHIMFIEQEPDGTIHCIEGNAMGVGSPALGGYYTGNDWKNKVGKISKRYRILV